jgi:hypothetical protein
MEQLVAFGARIAGLLDSRFYPLVFAESLFAL